MRTCRRVAGCAAAAAAAARLKRAHAHAPHAHAAHPAHAARGQRLLLGAAARRSSGPTDGARVRRGGRRVCGRGRRVAPHGLASPLAITPIRRPPAAAAAGSRALLDASGGGGDVAACDGAKLKVYNGWGGSQGWCNRGSLSACRHCSDRTSKEQPGQKNTHPVSKFAEYACTPYVRSPVEVPVESLFLLLFTVYALPFTLLYLGILLRAKRLRFTAVVSCGL